MPIILLLIPLGYALIQPATPAPVMLTFVSATSGLSPHEMLVLTRVMQPRMVAAIWTARSSYTASSR